MYLSTFFKGNTFTRLKNKSNIKRYAYVIFSLFPSNLSPKFRFRKPFVCFLYIF